MILRKYLCEPINGSCPSFQMFQSRPKRSFSLKKPQKLFHPTVIFNNIPVQRSTVQKHLGVYLDEKLNFNTHIAEKIG